MSPAPLDLKLLESTQEFGTLEGEDRKDARAAIHRLWLALREIERGRV